MVTMAQINRLDSRIDELAARLNPTPPLVYQVELIWTGADGVSRHDDGTPYVQEPGHILLSMDDPRFMDLPEFR
jgi:hypothetical protein